MTEPKLKPCPFCGNQEHVRLLDISPIKSWRVHCTNCGAEAGFYTVKRRAIRAWNSRVEPPLFGLKKTGRRTRWIYTKRGSMKGSGMFCYGEEKDLKELDK